MKCRMLYSMLIACSSVVAVAATVEQDTVVNVVESDSLTDLSAQAAFIDKLEEIWADTIPEYTVNPLFMPLVFEQQEVTPYEKLPFANDSVVSLTRDVNDFVPLQNEWLLSAIRDADRVRAARNYAMVHCPSVVKYNRDNMPDVPMEYVLVSDPTKQTITIVEKPMEIMTDLQPKKVKVKRWITEFTSAVQLSQVYVSDNWYQGGETNMSLMSDQRYSFKYNDLTGKLLFENFVQWKFNLTTSSTDSIHPVRISEDLFQFSSKFGYKAFGKWYYSASLLFKTQILNNYAVNSNDLNTQFLSPGEMNIGVGMSYTHSYTKPVKLSHTLTLSPLSYNLRFVGLHHIDPTKFGIESGHWARNEVGSSLDYRLTWDLRYNIRWTTHLNAFTNYEKSQFTWDNTIDFSLSSYFSTRVYFNLRYDDSVQRDEKLGYFQIKELLSLGFSFKI